MKLEELKPKHALFAGIEKLIKSKYSDLQFRYLAPSTLYLLTMDSDVRWLWTIRPLMS